MTAGFTTGGFLLKLVALSRQPPAYVSFRTRAWIHPWRLFADVPVVEGPEENIRRHLASLLVNLSANFSQRINLCKP